MSGATPCCRPSGIHVKLESGAHGCFPLRFAAQDLHAAFAAQLAAQAQHEQAAAHLAAAGRWAGAAAALGARGTAAAAAAAVQLCRHALAQLGPMEGSQLQQQLAASEKLLAGLAEAEGVDVPALLAEAAAAAAADAWAPSPPAAAPGSAPAAPPAAVGGGGGQPRRRYSAQQLLAAGAGVPPGRLAGLPEGLASSGSATGPGTSGTRSSGSRARYYSLQALLELSDSAGQLGPSAQQVLRKRLPPELLQEAAGADEKPGPGP